MNMQYFERNVNVLRQFLAGHTPEEIIQACELKQPRPLQLALEMGKWLIRRAHLANVPNPFTLDKYPKLFHNYMLRGVWSFNLHRVTLEHVVEEKEFLEERMVVELKLYRDSEEAKKLLPSKPKAISRHGSVNIVRDVAIARRVLDGLTYSAVAGEFGVTVNTVRSVFMKRFRVGILKVLRAKGEHPFTFEKYPYLHMTTNSGKVLNYYSIHQRELLVEKEFFLKLLDEQQV
jgi:hypothetical protein